jgi:nucleoside-diphosphate-sugar epimerase
MQVAIAGAHGKIAMPLTRLLRARGDTVVGLIRNADHAAEVEAQGARPRVCDLERADVEEIAAAIGGAEAAIFAAGAGPGSGAERKLTMDRDGAIKLLRAAEQTGAQRYLVISALGAESPPAPDDQEVFSVYLRAKAQADEAVMQSDIDWTILRPGPLTDDPARDRVRLGADPFRSEITRQDVAALIDALIHDSRAAGRVLYAGGGEDSVARAVEAALA